jgi:hypothetical protein
VCVAGGCREVLLAIPLDADRITPWSCGSRRSRHDRSRSWGVTLRRVEWVRVAGGGRPGDSVRFRVTCKKSRLYHSAAVAQRFADAVMRAIPAFAPRGSTGDDDVDDAEGAW